MVCRIFKLPVPNFVSVAIGFLVIFQLISRSFCILWMFSAATFRHYLFQMSLVASVIHNLFYLTLTSSQPLRIVYSIYQASEMYLLPYIPLSLCSNLVDMNLSKL